MSRAARERLPRDRSWQSKPTHPGVRIGRSNSIAVSTWTSGPVVVISELAVMEMPDGQGVGPTWLITITTCGKRPKPHHVRRALRAFGMQDAEEDNHFPGKTRSFFLVVEPARRSDCQCKSDETTVVEPDGFRWQRKVPG